MPPYIIGLLSIKAEQDMGDEVWQDVAESLGYTPKEINRFSGSNNPLAEIIADYKQRGGMPHRFINALYQTGSKGIVSKQLQENDTVMEEKKSGKPQQQTALREAVASSVSFGPFTLL